MGGSEILEPTSNAESVQAQALAPGGFEDGCYQSLCSRVSINPAPVKASHFKGGTVQRTAAITRTTKNT